MKIRTYRELRRFESFEERYAYLKLGGSPGRATFGFDRWINQSFYKSRQWRDIRNHVIARDNGCDLGIEGYEIHRELLVHHMNPITAVHIAHDEESILNPDFLITTTHRTHNAIHYGDESQLLIPFKERKPSDTKLW